MPVSHEHKVIFAHIPKTGGTSIEFALGMHGAKGNIGIERYKRQKKDFHHLYGAGMQHYTMAEINQFFHRCRFENYKCFGSLKAAIDKVTASSEPKAGFAPIFDQYFKFSVVRNPYSRLVSHFSWIDGKWKDKQQLDKHEFLQLIDEMIETKEYVTHPHLIPQNVYLLVNGNLATDKILHIENLNQEFEQLCEEQGFGELILERRMASTHRDYREYYNDQIQEKIYNLYKKDFELFGYDKAL